jgi:hypothetical protein
MVQVFKYLNLLFGLCCIYLNKCAIAVLEGSLVRFVSREARLWAT